MKRVFRLPGGRQRIDADAEEEFRFHLHERVEELMVREHRSREDAEREARRRFGDYAQYLSEVRGIDDSAFQRRTMMDVIDTLRRETRHAARSLARSPGFSLVAATTLALGLGAATTIFTLLDRVVLKPLAYPNAQRLVHLGTLWPKVKRGEEYGLAKGQYFYFRKYSSALADIVMYDSDVLAVPSDGSHPAERVPELNVSANTFTLLGIRPELGRAFTAQDELNPEGDPRVALISHGYWQRRFGGDPSIVGKRLSLGGGKSVEIVGVLPANSTLPDGTGDVWVRNHLDPADPPRNNHTHHAIGVLKPGATITGALADVQRLQAQMAREYPGVYAPAFIEHTGFAMSVTSLHDAVVGTTIVHALWLLFAAVGFVLLIAAANVANLFLVRMEARRREVALRTALGARRADLAIHYLAESLLLSLVAGLAAVALGDGLLHVVLSIAPQSLPRLDEVVFDWRGVAFCMTAALAFGTTFGLLPSTSLGAMVGLLRDGGRGLTTSRSRERTRRGLVLTQVALGVVLLSAALLMAKSFARLRNVHPGFDPVGVESMMIIAPPSRYDRPPQLLSFWRELTQRVEAIPGVIRAGASGTLPLADAGGCSGVITDVIATGRERGNCMPMTVVTPGYFEAMGIRVRGAAPTWSTVEAGTAPTVVTASFAKRFWGETNPIGHGLKPFADNNPYFTITGVADDILANGLENAPIQEAYFPPVGPPGIAHWEAYNAMHFVVRAPRLSQAALMAAVRGAVAQIDPDVPISDVLPMEVIVSQSMAQTSFAMLVLLLSAVIALALSAVGIYGVISYLVAQRRSEIGIRMALGAQMTEVMRVVVGQSVGLAAVGVGIGLCAAVATTRLLRSMLFEVSPSDPLILGGAGLVLLIVAALASIAPTRRALGVDPVEAMRG